MTKLNKKIYMVAGYNTVSMGTGRSEFHPKKPRPGLEHYVNEAGRKTLELIGGPDNVDECVVGNFMAARFNKQAHLGGFFPMIDEKLQYKPAIRVEGACASGGLALVTAIKNIMAGTSEVVLTLGVEVQNTVKAIYGADVLAGAGWYGKRKNGHAYFFPGQFSDRAGAYYEAYGYDYAREGMGRWFRNAIENARLCPTAQEYENKVPDLDALYKKLKPNGAAFVDHLNVLDCSKVSDGASAIAIVSEEGLKRIGIPKEQAVEVMAFGHKVRNITEDPPDPLELTCIKKTAAEALESAGITRNELGTVETHDCFSIAGVLGTEALGFAKPGEGAKFVAKGNTARDGMIPMNTTGGLIGWGHPTGGTGVHMAVTIWEQLTGNAGDAQIKITEEKPYGLTINMGGDDGTVIAIVFKRG
ncbi:MAG: beta-ketoacyl synthase N-terminal-like domain-containing protein [Bacteroidales bacterium]|jgi:acetyl-CoA C-acetyltransferase/acetyl-CoA acyltransferase|nr:beta-ketoacyl synthase N-terminal-like domain-containing protein [Bacteroidales bacterium]